ncbi:MAG: aldehyde dehydrogenase family protein, partial [Pseudomonadales bacterium]
MSNSLYINGQWLAGEGQSLTSLNPALGEAIWQGHAASSAQVEQAIKAARGAAGSWAQTPLAERQAIVERFGKLLVDNKEPMARLIAEETGKPLWETLTEAAAMAGKIAISVKANQERTGDSETDLGAARSALRHKPHGVVAV